MYRECLCARGRGQGGAWLAGEYVPARAFVGRSLRGKVCKSCDLCRLGAWICHTSVNAVWAACGCAVGTRKTCSNCAIKWRPHLTHPRHHTAPALPPPPSHIRPPFAVAVYWIVTALRWLHTPHTQIMPACPACLPAFCLLPAATCLTSGRSASLHPPHPWPSPAAVVAALWAFKIGYKCAEA